MTSTICEKSYAPDASYCNFYAGGDVVWSDDGKYMYCLNTTEVAVVDVGTGQVVQTYGTNATSSNNQDNPTTTTQRNDEEDEEDVIYTFALAANNQFLVTAHRSGLLRLWSLETHKVVKLWKAQHKGPVVKVQFSTCGNLLCSSGADSTLRVWDFVNSNCVCVLKEFSGPALVLEFHPHAAQKLLFVAGADNSIYCWNYASKNLIWKLRGHLSHVTALSFENESAECKYMASVSRDKVLIIWQLSDGTQHKVIPLYEELEGVCYLRDKENVKSTAVANLVVACAKGNLMLVDGKSAKFSTLVASENYAIKYLLQCAHAQQLAVVTAEQNILIFDRTTDNKTETKLECIKQLIGFNDEILDLCYLGENDRFLAVATNSKNIKIYDTVMQMNCKIIAGHTDTVITLSTSGENNLLLSAGKDLSICLWELEPETFTLRCVAKNSSSHTSTIGCLSFGYNVTSVFASVCQDGSLKVWNLQKPKKSETFSFQLKYSAVAHDKEVNSVAFSPNNKILATASQDKTAKLWSSDQHTCIGTLRGHTRGIWCVRFSPTDQIVLTASSDSSLRIWSLTSMSCIKRLDQECTILRAEFIDHGKFIVSAASDGLIKIWNIKTNECVQTLDEHEDRIWSLAVSGRSKAYFYSGGADSKLIKWHDVTEQCRNIQIDKRQEMLQQEQTLQSLLQQRQHMQKAFVLALTLGKPKVSYNIISNFVHERDPQAVKNIIAQLNSDQRATLLEHVKAWNTNSRHSKVSNEILHYILADIIADPTSQRTYNTANLVEVATPYVQRHFKRANELTKELAFLEFIVNCI